MRCSRTITRKSMLYRTKVEYGDWTMNHVQGCAHGCLYPCYAYLMAKRFGKAADYDDWCGPALVSNTLELLEREIPRYRDKIESVQLCFTTDPFMHGYEDIRDMSLAAIKMLNDADIPVTVLTKGTLPPSLATASAKNTYGITLVSLNEGYRKLTEPGASPYRERIASLRALHEAGCRTWVSIEPYPTPNLIDQDLGELLDEVSFVNQITFGRTNYNKKVSAYPGCKAWYAEQASIVRDFCERNEIGCWIKKGTAEKAGQVVHEGKRPSHRQAFDRLLGLEGAFDVDPDLSRKSA